MTDNAPPDREADDLGLTHEEWMDLRFAHNFGTIDPQPGTIEAAAFAQMDAYARREIDRIAADREAEEAWRASRRGDAPQAGPEPEAGQ
jgi:hypothetical protein